MLLLKGKEQTSGLDFWQSLWFCPLLDHSSDELFFFFPLEPKYSLKMPKSFRLMKSNALNLWPPSILLDTCLSLEGAGGVIGVDRCSLETREHTCSVPPNHYLIILPENPLETEHLGASVVPGRAVGLSCGSAGYLGVAVSPTAPPGVLFDHQMSRKHRHSSVRSARRLPAHGLTEARCLLVACRLPRWSLCSCTFLSKICTTLAKRMCTLKQTPPFLPPSIKSTENPSVSNM